MSAWLLATISAHVSSSLGARQALLTSLLLPVFRQLPQGALSSSPCLYLGLWGISTGAGPWRAILKHNIQVTCQNNHD